MSVLARLLQPFRARRDAEVAEQQRRLIAGHVPAQRRPSAGS